MARRTSRRLRIETALNSVATPVFLVDNRRRIVFINQALESITGWELAEVAGELCEFNSEADSGSLQELTGSLCPTPDALHGTVLEIPAQYVHRATRERTSCLLHLQPLHDEDGVSLVLGIAAPERTPSRTLDSSVINDVHAELASLRHTLREQYQISGLVASSPSMQRVANQIRLASQTDSTVHITGPAGSGREHVARVIHYGSPHGATAFIPLDCRTLPPRELQETIERLVESDWAELSPVSAIHPGCIYLADVDQMPRDVQQRLVDFLASDRGVAFESAARLISSSPVPVDQLLEGQELVDELLYRLTALQISLSPLAGRTEDLDLLMQHFLERHNRGRATQLQGFADAVRQHFHEYNWPGNVEELRQVIEEAVTRCDDAHVTEEHLPLRFRTGLDAQTLVPGHAAISEPLDELLARVEREQIEAALARFGHNKAKAARLLGISRASLYRRMKNHGVPES